MSRARIPVAKVLVAALVALVGVSAAWTQDTGRGDVLLQQMVSLVIAHNPVLMSRQRLVNEAQRIPDRAAGFTVPGMNVGVGLYTWNPYSGSFGILPSVTVGLSFSFSDPSRELTILKVSEEKELAKQGWETARDTAVGTLFSRVRDVLKLKSQGKNLRALRSYLHDYSVLSDSQRTEQAISPDKLWDLRERISTIDIQLDTLDAQIDITTMEAAMSLGGDAWQELLALLRQLGA